jgi:hypothetical protein
MARCSTQQQAQDACHIVHTLRDTDQLIALRHGRKQCGWRRRDWRIESHSEMPNVEVCRRPHYVLIPEAEQCRDVVAAGEDGERVGGIGLSAGVGVVGATQVTRISRFRTSLTTRHQPDGC